MSKASDMVRENFKKGDDIRDAGLTTPEDVERFDDIVYGNDAKWQSLDVYRPKRCEGILPVIVSVHGGGWVYGDKERYQYYCMSLAQQGFAVINFTYRLAPEFKFPAAIEDTNKVFQFVFDYAEKYGFDTEHIFAVGDSAGAHQLGLYVAACTNPDYAKRYAFTIPKEFAPTAVAFNCGAYRIDDKTDDLTKKLMEDYLPGGRNDRELEEICVVKHMTENFPPTFYMTCTGDFLINQAFVLEEKLLACKVPHVFRFYGDAGTELGHVFHCNIKLDAARKCNRDECEFFKEFLE